MKELRERKAKGRPKRQPLNKEIENDLIAENQQHNKRLEYHKMENEYLKNWIP